MKDTKPSLAAFRCGAKPGCETVQIANAFIDPFDFFQQLANEMGIYALWVIEHRDRKFKSMIYS